MHNDRRPAIVGMNNPLSTNPEHALYPHPPGCTGYRLWQLLAGRTGASRSDYIRTFDRMNLVTGPWSKTAARVRAAQLRSLLVGRTVLVLGEEVRECFGLPRMLVHPVVLDGTTFRQLPHPSGRNLWYNDETNRSIAALLLEEMYEGHQGTKRERGVPTGPLVDSGPR